MINTLEKTLAPKLFYSKSSAILFLLLGLGYVGIFLLQKPAYFLTDDLDFFLGIIFAPYIIRQVDTAKSVRFGVWSILLFTTLFFWRSNTFYFFAFGFSLLFLVESFFYRVNSLAVLLLVACSAVFRQIANIWTFPIRLKMTDWTGQVLAWIGFPVEVAGNVIHMDGQPFSVAPACMGMNMLVTAFVLALLILAFFERKYYACPDSGGITTPLWKASLFCGIALGLAIFSNLVRLTALVIFKIMPENWLHDALGILSLAVYMLLPFFFLMRFFYKKNNAVTKSKKPKSSKFIFSNSKILALPHLMLLGLLFWTGQQFAQQLEFEDATFPKIEVAGFQKAVDEKGVLKMENDELLVYVKPPVRIFQGTHDPRFCWKGSGYEFSNIQKKTFGKHDIYTALLTKGKDKLHTAWWLDNGSEKTIGEWDWRQKTLEGGTAFRLVNLTSEDEITLETAVSEWLKFDLFQ